ncbi:hypothetical protein [Allokutzneria multivorans]|uniref:hypothetical protein n=1 Tax=Allokutzneria multivorans TaxID=1142134 RepID=UPI0031E95520
MEDNTRDTLVELRSADDRAPHVAAAVRTSLRDFFGDAESAIARDFVVTVEDGDRPETLMVLLRRGGFVAGFGVFDADNGAETLAAVADRLQDAITEEFRVATPRCPGHPHPLSVRVIDAEPMWLCPKDNNHFACRIGEYEKPPPAP